MEFILRLMGFIIGCTLFVVGLQFWPVSVVGFVIAAVAMPNSYLNPNA